MPLTITEIYHHDRSVAATGEERRRVWRMYCRALLITAAERTIGGGAANWRRGSLTDEDDEPDLAWRRAGGDDELSVRYKWFWGAISDTDLHELWTTLERARHRSDDE
ncbi:hypothetical protein EWE75_01320 [Sphingomonas populi]|uniref:Uncharacterized protein n=1 Tax=Sphingomonas populi TaxID=2484750 RepID=A0A4Q6Y2K3_9SPHN|nr:hypothetical protein [Sphingomonas populi]RZF66521.1 hypothetical protein EWE75_01320 [Sphingomonas populi]